MKSMSHSYAAAQEIAPPLGGANSDEDTRGRKTLALLMAARYGQLGASSRLRLIQYRPFLEQAGIATSLRGFLSDGYVRALYGKGSRLPGIAGAYARALSLPLAARRHDILWIEKEFLPWLPYAAERLAIGGKPYILDFDDAWSLRYAQSSSGLVRRALGTKFQRLVQGAALTIVANDTLLAWAQAQGAKATLRLPTVVDLDRYPLSPAPDGVFTLGWIGTPLTAAYLDTIAEPLRILAAEAPLRLLIIGAPDKRIEGVDCVHAEWSEASEATMIARCHAGIMPLPDDDWAWGKSGYKLIQYMALGRPAMASAIGANRQIVQHDETGYLASTPADWLSGLRALRDDAARRAAFGDSARRRVAEYFSLQVTAPKLIEAIRRVAAG
jgi:glycosyltransferase involved in cell wall biosynthesis